GQDQYISGLQFGGQFVGAHQRRLLGRALLLGRLHPAAQQIAVQVRDRLLAEIPNLNAVAAMSDFPLLDKGFGKLTGYRTLLAGTAFDDEYTGHGETPKQVDYLDGPHVTQDEVD